MNAPSDRAGPDDPRLALDLAEQVLALRTRVEELSTIAEQALARAAIAERRLGPLGSPRVKRVLRPAATAWRGARDASRRVLGRRSRPSRPDVQRVPIFIIVRDRLEPLRLLLDWLDRAGQHEVVLVDNASTYPPLVQALDASPHEVIRLERNLGPRAPWLSGLVADRALNRPYVVTDPDVVPDRDCPLDAIGHFTELLERYPDTPKVGFGLRIDDLPDGFAHRRDVVEWESQWWVDELEPGVYRAPLDTTFSLYRAGRAWHEFTALRTGPPYVARHLPWYSDTERPTAEESYYRDHLDPLVNSWDQTGLPAWFRAALDERQGQRAER
jgi:hypothetical protein